MDIPEIIIHNNTDEPVCPYCGFYFYDFQNEKDEDLIYCYECGKEFMYKRYRFYTYDTWRKDEQA